CCVVPWKYSAELFGMFEPASTSVSFARLALPLARSLEPRPNEFRQPSCWPAGLLLLHGQAVAVPSPEQNGALPLSHSSGTPFWFVSALVWAAMSHPSG